MTQEEKQLLLQDLCARLPYQPMCEFTDTEDDFCTATAALGYSLRDFIAGKVLIKPYLRPMESMTEGEKKEIGELLDASIEIDSDGNIIYFSGTDFIPRSDYQIYIDYLTSHYFDYRGLIPMGLALPVKEGMYNN